MLDYKFIEDRYANFDYKAIWAKYPNDRREINAHLRKNGLTHSRDDYNKWLSNVHNFWFFDEPSRINSYIAGFIAADGCIHNGECKVEVAATDLKHLRNISQIISPDIKVKKRAGKNSVVFRFKNEQLITGLRDNFNITPAKSLNLQPPNLTEQSHIDAFMLGYWDGDGSCFYGNRYKDTSYLRLSCNGSYDMMNWMQENLPLPARVEQGHGNVHMIRYNGMKAKEIHDYLYDPTLPVLRRKWGKEYKLHHDQ